MQQIFLSFFLLSLLKIYKRKYKKNQRNRAISRGDEKCIVCLAFALNLIDASEIVGRDIHEKFVSEIIASHCHI